MAPHDIYLAQPAPRPLDYHGALIDACRRVTATDQWTANQLMGRRWPIGCVALEITQRCNLDCTACYLSEHSEAVKDVPLEELFRRIDLIFDHYGTNTNVQVTGGDPTLRKREELVAIVRRLSRKGMRPALVTNGIRAHREMLVELVEAGLVDIAFHVDLTQGRRGYDSEVALNEIRQDYIERARGLPLSVMFNTTVFDRNFEEIPEIVQFFVRKLRCRAPGILPACGRNRPRHIGMPERSDHGAVGSGADRERRKIADLLRRTARRACAL